VSLRAAVAIIALVIGCFWTLRRPYIGVLLNIAVFHLNLRALGSGLEEIRFQFVLTILLIVSYILNREELNKEPEQPQPPIYWMFAFLGMTFLTSAWAVADAAKAFDSAVDFSKIVLFSWFMTKIVKTEKELTTLLYVMFAGMWYVSFMVQWGVDFDWVSVEEAEVATGGTGAHLMMFMPMLILLALFGKWRERLVVILVIPFVLNYMPNAVSGSRSTLVMFATSMAFLFIFAPGSIRFKAALPIAAAGLIFVFYLTPAEYWEDMASILAPQTEGSARSRFAINDASFAIISDYPHGIGYNNYSDISMHYMSEEWLTDLGTRDAHNSYLKVMAEFGVVGIVIWVGTFFVTWLFFRKVRKTMKNGQPPTRLQLYALAFELGLMGITAGIWTHSYNDLDTLYWFVAFSCIVYNLHLKQNATETPPQAEEIPLRAKLQQNFKPPRNFVPAGARASAPSR
jgi:O-antigen ligase